jgi:Flp pilus assembly protein TadD
LILGLQSYQYAVSLVPDDAMYWSLLAAFCAQNSVNINDLGIPAAQKAVVLSRNDPAALDVLGWNYLRAGRYIEAESALKLALEHDPNYAPAHVHLATVYLQTNDRVAAYDHLVKAHDLGSAEADAALKQYFP